MRSSTGEVEFDKACLGEVEMKPERDGSKYGKIGMYKSTLHKSALLNGGLTMKNKG